MPSRVSVELSPSSATNSMTTLASPFSAPVSVASSSVTTTGVSKKAIALAAISTSPPGSAGMDNATMGFPTASPSSSSPSASFSSSSAPSSPSSSTLSLPASTMSPTTTSVIAGKDKGKGKARVDEALERDRALSCTGPRANQNQEDSCTTQSSDALLPMNNNKNINDNHNNFGIIQYTQQQQQRSELYYGEPHTAPTPSLSSLQVQQQYDGESFEIAGKGNGKGKGKGKASADLALQDNGAAEGEGTGKGKDSVAYYDDSEICDDTEDDGLNDSVRPGTLASHGRFATRIGTTIQSKASAAGSTTSSSPSRSDLYARPNARSSKSSSLTSLSSVEEEKDEHSKSSTAAKETAMSAVAAAAAAAVTSSSSSSRVRPATVSAMTGKGKGVRSTTTSGIGSGSGSGSGSGFSHPRVASASAQFSYSNGMGSSGGSGSGAGSGSGSSSGSSSKPALNRALTGPATLQRPFLKSMASSSAIPAVPSLPSATPREDEVSELPDLSAFSYEALPDDFDFGDLPFYDTDPRTGTIYGDPHAITRPYLNPQAYFDLYKFTHDEADPRKTNVFNKHGTLLYYHPGRHIGQEQDSLRSQAHNQPIWTMTGRTSTWGTLTASEMISKRQIRIVMESNKKKAASGESNEPLARFVFRWKEDDFVVEYRKQKDQYRITASQMCGGDSKWKPPQPKPTQTMFHGMGMDTPGNPHIPITVGTPSPFDSTRYLQLISEYRLNSGPVLKRGDFELYNPDTFPAEFRTFLMLVSLVILEMMRPVDDKLFFKEFPQAAHLRSKVAGAGGIRSAVGGGGIGGGVPMMNGRPSHLAVLGVVGSAGYAGSAGSSPSASSLNIDRTSISISSASMKAAAVSVVDVGPVSTPTISRAATAPVVSASAGAGAANSSAKSATPAPVKKSRWGSIFKK